MGMMEPDLLTQKVQSSCKFSSIVIVHLEIGYYILKRHIQLVDFAVRES